MKIDTKVFIGVFFILIGILFFLEQVANFTIDVSEIIRIWWPIIFVVWGANEISNKKSNYLLPIFGILSGVFLIADNLDILPWGFWGTMWPLVFILIGLHFIFGRNSKFNLDPRKNSKRNNDNSASNSDDPFANNPFNSANFNPGNFNADTFNFNKSSKDYSPDILDVNAFFSGNTNRITSRNFKGGEINVIFAGSEIDFRDSDLADNLINLEINAIFGGVEIYIPYNWQVEIYGTPVFGGVSNKTRFDNSYIPEINRKQRILRINYSVVFGGIEIKN